MDESKCAALKAELASQQPSPVVTIERFFDGNDDAASIGCNLIEHPGIEFFREVLLGLKRRDDVVAVYAQIAELDPGPDNWPFTDTIVVIGCIERNKLMEVVSILQPTDVGSDQTFNALAKMHAAHAWTVWWD